MGTTYREFVRGTEFLRDTIAMMEGFEENKQLSPDYYYPMVCGIKDMDDFPIEELKPEAIKTIKVIDLPGNEPREISAYVDEEQWAYVVTKS